MISQPQHGRAHNLFRIYVACPQSNAVQHKSATPRRTKQNHGVNDNSIKAAAAAAAALRINNEERTNTETYARKRV